MHASHSTVEASHDFPTNCRLLQHGFSFLLIQWALCVCLCVCVCINMLQLKCTSAGAA